MSITGRFSTAPIEAEAAGHSSTSRNGCVSSASVVGLSAGCTRRHAAMNSCGAPWGTSFGSRGSTFMLCRCLITAAGWLHSCACSPARSISVRAVIISSTHTPSAQMSMRRRDADLAPVSGAMYSGVPTTLLLSLLPAFQVPRPRSASLRATPAPWRERRQLPGLRSWWLMPWRWRYWRPQTMLRVNQRTAGWSSAPKVEMSCARLPPSQSSITRCASCSNVTSSMNPTTLGCCSMRSSSASDVIFLFLFDASLALCLLARAIFIARISPVVLLLTTRTTPYAPSPSRLYVWIQSYDSTGLLFDPRFTMSSPSRSTTGAICFHSSAVK
mmetsp:Transcript_43328/g.101774  ORF Transcript_43328/g.101774 Transcript_43328/m.101774 type:complete len:328 (-) Transcript_43328:938-1921(-)